MNGAAFANRIKKNVFGSYVRALECLDPEIARSILASQREFLLAGSAFFAKEAEYADKAIAKFERDQRHDAASGE